jgi:signal transduction histidine kinase
LRTLSLNARIVLIASSSIVFSVALILFIAYDRLVRDFEQVLTERQALQTSAVASRVNEELTTRLNALGAFASVLTDGNDLLPLQHLKTLLGRQPTLERLFGGGLLIFDDRSIAIAENTFVPNRLGTSYADRPHFKRAMQSRTPIVSRPIIGRTTGLPLLSFLAPIESDHGDLLGLAGGTINLAEAGIIPEELKIDEGTILKVLDTSNFIQVDALRKDQPAPDLPAPGEDPLIDAALSGIPFGVVKDLAGQRWVYTTQHLDRLGWLFLSAAPYEKAIQPARASFRSFLWLSVVAMLPLLLLTYTVSRAATRQLGAMSRKINKMATDVSSTQRLTTQGPAETRNLAKAFNTLMEQREALDILKNQFVSNVSHELRTPLTSINGSLKLLQSGSAGELPPKASAMVELALRNGQQLQSLITDLLDFDKAVAGKLSVQMRDIELIDAIEAACAGNQPMARHYSVELVGKSGGELRVVADPARLRQVLDNLISNAIKHSPKGGIVSIEAHSSAPGVVRITVSDQGDGVPEHFLPQLFLRFSQAEAGSNRAKAGTGLGLAICKELARLMSGEMGYHFKDGAHFWLELPETNHQGEEHYENA